MDNVQTMFRYDTSGQWFKGNTHIHSTASDGGKTIPEISELYAGAGYDFLFCTDHWVCSDVSEIETKTPVLLLDGIELDGHDESGTIFHVVCLGRVKGLTRDDGLEEGLRKAREQGAIAVLAHPRWSGNSLADTARFSFDGVEVYNHVCRWLNGKGGGLTHWDAMLKRDRGTLCFAVDDAHLKPEHPGYDGGWIVVNAPDLSVQNVMSAIRRGNFYSSCGPSLTSLRLEDETLHIECGPVQFIRLIGPANVGWRAGSFDGQTLNRVSVRVPRDWDYVCVELEDQRGRRAWTNPLFVDQQAMPSP